MAVQLLRVQGECAGHMSEQMIGDQDGQLCGNNCLGTMVMYGPRAGDIHSHQRWPPCYNIYLLQTHILLYKRLSIAHCPNYQSTQSPRILPF